VRDNVVSDDVTITSSLRSDVIILGKKLSIFLVKWVLRMVRAKNYEIVFSLDSMAVWFCWNLENLENARSNNWRKLRRKHVRQVIFSILLLGLQMRSAAAVSDCALSCRVAMVLRYVGLFVPTLGYLLCQQMVNWSAVDAASEICASDSLLTTFR